MKLTITGDAYALTSAIKVADIELLKKHNPDALTVKDADGKNTVFAVSYNDGKPNVTGFSVTFGGKTRDEDGFATITGVIPAGFASAEAAKGFVAETFGGVVAYLEQLEKSVPKAAEEVRENRKKLVDSITVA